jgi:hypothetical protein
VHGDASEVLLDVSCMCVKKKKKCVTRRTGDYVATNRWLTKGCSREEQGAVHQPHTKGWIGTNVLKLTTNVHRNSGV